MISTEFQKNVQAGDIFSVRSALIDYLIVDRTFMKFDEALAFAGKNMDVIVPFDGKALQEDTAGWDEDYLNLAKVGLLNNFSRERIDHLKAVIKTVMPAEQTDSAFDTAAYRGAEDSSSRASRTGREVIEEVPSLGKPTGGSTTSGSRTGRETIREEEKIVSAKAKVGVGSAMIIGGAAVAVAGLVAEEALMIGTGVVVAGAGCVIALTK